MAFLTDLIKSSISAVVEPIAETVDALHTSDEEKATAKASLESIVSERFEAQSRVIIETVKARARLSAIEASSGDSYTRRARPTVVYVGLLVLVFNHALYPGLWTLFEVALPTIDLPSVFWLGWSGIVSTWSIGRSLEKRAAIAKDTNID